MAYFSITSVHQRIKLSVDVLLSENILNLYSNRIVGNDDGGKIFTPQEYEQYKREVLPMVSNSQSKGFLIYFKIKNYNSILFCSG